MQMHTNPVVASPTSSFDEAMKANDAAVARFNSLPATIEEGTDAFEREEQLLFAAGRAADAAVPTSWTDFGRWVEHLCADGANAIDDDNARRLLSHVRRLLGRSVSSSEWDAAMQEYERVRATPYDGDKDGDEHPHTVTVDRLLNMPAPHGDALAWKIDHLFQPEGNGFIGCYAYSFVKPTLADAVRLAGGKPLGPLA